MALSGSKRPSRLFTGLERLNFDERATMDAERFPGISVSLGSPPSFPILTAFVIL